MKTALLSLILALVIGIFCFFQFDRLHKEKIQENTQISQALDQIKNEMTKLGADLAQTKNALAELQKTFQSIKLDENWKIAEANHLLHLAAIELQVSRNLSGSISLLEAADNHLSSIQDSKLLPLREQIAKEKAKLQAIKLPDTEKIWLEVGVLMEEVPSLPTRGNRTAEQGKNGEKASAVTKESKIKEDTENSNWKKGLANTWDELKDLIKIQKHSLAIEPVLKEPEQALAKENLLLIFEQMRWAILHRQNTIYQRNIQNAKDWLNRYFEVKDNRVEKMQTTLDELAKMDLQPALPDLSPTLQILQHKG